MEGRSPEISAIEKTDDGFSEKKLAKARERYRKGLVATTQKGIGKRRDRKKQVSRRDGI